MPRATVIINRFRNGTQGLLDHIEEVEREIHTSSFYGPEMAGCAQMPIRRQHYQWIEYNGKRYHVTVGKDSKYELDLPQEGCLL